MHGRLPLLAAILAFTLWPNPAAAHGMRTAYVEIVEHAPGQAIVRLRTTVPARVKAVFPAVCEPKESAEPPQHKAHSLAQGGSLLSFRCKGPLSGQSVRIEGLGSEISEAVVWVDQENGVRSTHLLTAGSSTLRIPAESRAWTSFTEYVPLGLRHILEGADHLSFLLLIVLILRRPKAILLAETAFTLSHGLSFSAAALGWLVVSKEATEACIAASLLLLALDVPQKESSPAQVTQTTGLALAFGLIHGLGFASGMTELGIPEKNVGWALLGFGVGVEAGQIAFLAAALAIAHFASQLRFPFDPRMVLMYAIGGLAAFWFIDRVRSGLVGIGL